jgi:hypothetical protein
MEEIAIMLEDVLDEVRDALEYGRSLGYTECLNQTIGKKPSTSNADQAIDFYVNSIKEAYESED